MFLIREEEIARRRCIASALPVALMSQRPSVEFVGAEMESDDVVEFAGELKGIPSGALCEGGVD